MPLPIEEFVEQFNSCFGPDFLPEGFARARVTTDGGMCIYIGNRDLQVREDLSFVGRGTDVTRPPLTPGTADG